ncbi:hypothetical protein ACO0M4_05920 [Streptomyces sp. RGM 3693]|uniref:hypothetical protein n=1 Tax=Streptomyces sp. RGM 3693 TaxID=3413284 RepID=UPI003D2B27ED
MITSVDGEPTADAAADRLKKVLEGAGINVEVGTALFHGGPHVEISMLACEPAGFAALRLLHLLPDSCCCPVCRYVLSPPDDSERMAAILGRAIERALDGERINLSAHSGCSHCDVPDGVEPDSPVRPVLALRLADGIEAGLRALACSEGTPPQLPCCSVFHP